MNNAQFFAAEITESFQDYMRFETTHILCELSRIHYPCDECVHGNDCERCFFDTLIWLQKEHDPDVLRNGAGVEEYDEVLVRDNEADSWKKREFGFYEECGLFWCYQRDEALGKTVLVPWFQAKRIRKTKVEG